MQIEIGIPNNFHSERRYIIQIFLRELVDCNLVYSVHEDNSQTTIKFPNGSTLLVKDSFFSQLNPEHEYATQSNIPTNVKNVTDVDVGIHSKSKTNLTEIFGAAEFIHDGKSITCHLDIFASAFFMLSRWEEHANNQTDSHQRFPADQSLAYKYDFLDRPVVNEYIELFKSLVHQLCPTVRSKQRSFNFSNTHDIDKLELFESARDFFLKPIKASILRKDPSIFLHQAKLAWNAAHGTDPFFNFSYLMDVSESANITSHFYFMAANTRSVYDNGYDISDPRLKDIFKEIKSRGHKIGFHPSYYTFKNTKLFSEEKTRLQIATATEISTGRQHYLRFSAPQTWQLWEDNGMTESSTISYSGYSGFRCGICYQFPVFNFLTKKQLKLNEKPLTAMEASIAKNGSTARASLSKYLSQSIEQVKRYEGDYVLLWHNSSFKYSVWKQYEGAFEQTIDTAGLLLNGP